MPYLGESASIREGFSLETPKHALVRRAVDPVRARMEHIHSTVVQGGLRDEFSQWLALGLSEEHVLVGRPSGRMSRREAGQQRGWAPSLVFALETALAEWSLGRAAARLGVPPARLQVLVEDLPLATPDSSWSGKVLDLDAESRFLAGDPTALVSTLYQRLLPRLVRHDLGVYHTPAVLARFVVDLAPRKLADVTQTPGSQGRKRAARDAACRYRWMDPSCGFGVFPVVLAERLGSEWPGRVMGRDISPLALVQSRIALLELSRLQLGMSEKRAVDAVMDALRLEDVLFPETAEPFGGQVDILVGNPPWVTWDRLVPSYRERVKELVAHRPHLYDKSGFEMLMGGATDDISALFTALASERFLRKGGLVAMLLKQALLTNETGSWFRALDAADPSVRLSMVQVEDLSRCRGLFGRGGQQAMVFMARKGAPGTESIPVGLWQRQGRDVTLSQRVTARRRDPTLPGSPWRLDGRLPGTRARGESTGEPLEESLSEEGGRSWAGSRERIPAEAAAGASAGSRGGPGQGDVARWTYASQIHHGLKHDAEGLFVFTKIEVLEPGLVRAWPKQGGDPVILETGRLFRYVKPRHVQAWRLRGWEYVLVPQERAGAHDEGAFAATFPASLAYLSSHAERLAARRSRVFDSGPFYGMFGLGSYTWDRYRILWSGLGYRPLFCPALAEPDPLLGDALLLPDSGCYSLSVEDEMEQWYLVGLLNSGPGRKAIEAVALGSKRPLSKTAMSHLSLPRFDGRRTEMVQIAEAAREAWHRLGEIRRESGEGRSLESEPGNLLDLERGIDELAEHLVTF